MWEDEDLSKAVPVSIHTEEGVKYPNIYNIRIKEAKYELSRAAIGHACSMYRKTGLSVHMGYEEHICFHISQLLLLNISLSFPLAQPCQDRRSSVDQLLAFELFVYFEVLIRTLISEKTAWSSKGTVII